MYEMVLTNIWVFCCDAWLKSAVNFVPVVIERRSFNCRKEPILSQSFFA
jgi:hypothetical protein